jgi:Na+/phosphate symporter
MQESHDPNLFLTSLPVAGVEHPIYRPGVARPSRTAPKVWRKIHLGKILFFTISLFLFILAITLMKEGARGFAPLLRNQLSFTNLPNCLGFGWSFAYVIMSGSPVAATSLTFFDAGAIGRMEAFAMITGSRLGASFIVLIIGFLYMLRGRNRSSSLSMGLLSLTVTATTYLPGLLLGVIILEQGFLDHIQLGSGTVLSSASDALIEPIAGFIISVSSGSITFLIGLGAILVSFRLLDGCLPQMSLNAYQAGRVSRFIYRPWVMFLLGSAITLISMSVSVSLSILVPLGDRGFVRRENVIPYIMGANITTFIDTLLAAVLLDNPSAFTVVLVEMVSITIVSVAILVASYRKYQMMILNIVGWITDNDRNLSVLTVFILIFPILLMAI